MEIQSMELEPTKENILSTLTENLLGRNNDVWRFIRICQYQKRKCSIALDAKWGAGKTFFVKQAKMLIDAYNPFSKELLDDEKKIIQSIFNQIGLVIRDDFLSSPQVSVYYDAWTNDNDNDPMLSILYEIVKTTTLEYDVHKQGNIAEKVVSIVDVITGKNIKEAFEVFRGDDCFSSIQNQKNIHSMIEEFFDSLLSEQGDRLVVFIDELDRCKPSFAIQLLERIKHYFSNDRITFVFSINDAQLQQTIKRYYGADFDSCRYLDRFFDYRISLPPANMQRYYEKIGLNSYDVFEKICQAVTRRQNMGLREIEKYARRSRMALEKHRDHRSY